MWVILTVLSAASLSLRDAALKNDRDASRSIFVVWSMYFVAMLCFGLFFFVASFFSEMEIKIEPGFLKALLIVSVLDTAAALFYKAALEKGDLSKVTQMLSFVPVFQILTGKLILNETVSWVGCLGIFLILAGCLMLQSGGKLLSVREFISLTISDKGSMYMLGVALLWSVSSVYHKVGALKSSGNFWALSVCSALSLTLGVLVLVKMRAGTQNSKRKYKSYFLPGIANALTLSTYYTALSFGAVAYVSALRRLSMLGNVVVGKVFFKEESFRQRIMATLVMILGAVLIGFA